MSSTDQWTLVFCCSWCSVYCISNCMDRMSRREPVNRNCRWNNGDIVVWCREDGNIAKGGSQICVICEQYGTEVKDGLMIWYLCLQNGCVPAKIINVIHVCMYVYFNHVVIIVDFSGTQWYYTVNVHAQILWFYEIEIEKSCFSCLYIVF